MYCTMGLRVDYLIANNIRDLGWKRTRRFILVSETCKIILLKKIIFYITRNKPDFCKVNLNKVYVLKVFSIAIYVIDHQSLHRLQSYFRVFTQSACHIFFLRCVRKSFSFINSQAIQTYLFSYYFTLFSQKRHQSICDFTCEFCLLQFQCYLIEHSQVNRMCP